MTPRAKARKLRPWYFRADTAKTVGPIVVALWGSFLSTKKSDTVGIEARENLASFAVFSQATYDSLKTVRKDLTATKIRLRMVERKLGVKGILTSQQWKQYAEPDGPPMPPPRWQSIRKLFAGLFNPFRRRG